MPRRNLLLLIGVSLVSLICYQKVLSNRYGRILVDAMTQIERRSLEPVGQEDLFEGAMEGMVGRLDEFSAFISPRKLPEFWETVDQEFGGIGIEIIFDPTTKQLTVVRPLVGTPAYEAGIRAGDKILRIDGQSTQGLSGDDAIARMRGKPGQPVTLSILHEGEQQPIEVKLVRAIIRVDTVLGDTRRPAGSWDYFLDGHPGVGYLRINVFAETTAKELRGALEKMQPEMRGLILDLRDDPGGWLTAAVEVCDLFIDSGVIVTTRRRDGSVKNAYTATAEGTFPGFPIAVLVNHYTASASEIVAACLQDHQRAVVVGQRTYGKGTVQEVLELGGGEGALKLTTASYWRPSGKNIHRVKGATEKDDWGVMPDKGYEVVVEGEELTKLRMWRYRRDGYKPPGEEPPPGEADQSLENDKQLLKAVEYIEKQTGNTPPPPREKGGG
jgi:carboxyl-terminal processing protease